MRQTVKILYESIHSQLAMNEDKSESSDKGSSGRGPFLNTMMMNSFRASFRKPRSLERQASKLPTLLTIDEVLVDAARAHRPNTATEGPLTPVSGNGINVSPTVRSAVDGTVPATRDAISDVALHGRLTALHIHPDFGGQGYMQIPIHELIQKYSIKRKALKSSETESLWNYYRNNGSITDEMLERFAGTATLVTIVTVYYAVGCLFCK
jgi:hypothetical protein